MTVKECEKVEESVLGRYLDPELFHLLGDRVDDVLICLIV